MANYGQRVAAFAANRTAAGRAAAYAEKMGAPSPVGMSNTARTVALAMKRAKAAPLPRHVRGSQSAVAAAAGVLWKAPQTGAVRAMPRPLIAEMRDSSPWYRSYGPIVGDRPPLVVNSIGGIDGWFDVVKGVAKTIVPTKTIVGKLLAGDTAGAGKAALTMGRQAIKPGAAAPVPMSNTQAIITSFKPQSGGQTAMLVGAGVLALGLGFLVLRR